MPFETGGRADKFGNRYENKWVILKLLDLIEEKIDGIVLEAIGDDEIGVDIWANEKDGCRIAYQCKGRNASKEIWDVSSLKAGGIIAKSKKQLDRNPMHKFSLVSAANCLMLVDLTNRARNTSSNPEDFLKFQIEDSSKEFREFFYSYCTALGLDFSKPTELAKILDYLSRTYFNFFSDTEVEKQKIFDRIKFLFIGNETIIYNHLQSFMEEDILGKTINNSQVVNYLMSKDVKFRDSNNDERILPRILTLNKEYKNTFLSISDKLFERSEFKKCIEEIENEKSLLIHGKAGSGKSGCTQAIIEYCESTKKAYIAIKLDKKIPKGSSRNFGNSLGLDESIVHCLGRMSKDNCCVIILDQLDALRWTQSHSRDALEVCSEIIQEVKNLNHDREKKISLVLVCRTYDLENDNNIKLLFESKSEKNSEWIKIAVGDFDEKILLEVIGEAYNGFSSKLKKLLHTPVNLYIWDKLEKKSEFNEFSTNTQLIDEWWRQLCINSEKDEIAESELNDFKNKIIDKMTSSNKMSVGKIGLIKSYKSLEYLVSNGMLIDNGMNISFVHQSMYDFFIVENMIARFFDGERIELLVGTKEKQTPVKRYQLQMLLQYVSEQDIDSFMHIGKEILNSEQIRFYMKYVFFEVLGQITEIDYVVQSFIKEWLFDEEYMTHIIDSVIRGHIHFVELLIDEGIISLWLESEDSEKAVDLLYSVRDQDSYKVRGFLKNILFKSEDLDKKLLDAFGYNAASEHEELFLIRMELYKLYPEFLKFHNINIKELFENGELRAISLLELFLVNKNKNKGSQIYKYSEEYWDELSDVIIKNSKIIIERLLPYLPLDFEFSYKNNEWTGKNKYEMNVERACVQLIKKAILATIKEDTNWFWEKFSTYSGKGYGLINELVLSGLQSMSSEESDKVIAYICKDIQFNIFDETSGNTDYLQLAKEVISIHSRHCSIENFKNLEDEIYYYHEKDEKELYKWRIEYNKKDNGNRRVYCPFWGEVQAQLLPRLDSERISTKTQELIRVLDRRFNGIFTLHKYYKGHSGSVYSVISGKENSISDKQWKMILTNVKLKTSRVSKWQETKGGFLSNSMEDFSSSFRTAVEKEPIRFIKLFMTLDKDIEDIFVHSFFNALEYSEKLKEIDITEEILEEMIVKFSFSHLKTIAKSICGIVYRNSNKKWSDEIVDIIKSITMDVNNSFDSEMYSQRIEGEKLDSFEELHSTSYNCTKGVSAKAIGSLIRNNSKMFEKFKDSIDYLVNDINLAVRMGSIEALHSVYNIDNEWATEKIIRLFNENHMNVGHPKSGRFLFLIYPNHKKEILSAIMKCFNSEDEHLKKMGSYYLTEMYFVYGEFQNVMEDLIKNCDDRVKWIIEIAVIYFGKEKYFEKAKKLLVLSINCGTEHSYSRLFYDNLIDLKRDMEFITALFMSNRGKDLIPLFVQYLENGAYSIIEFSSLIVSLLKLILSNRNLNIRVPYYIDDELSKLVFTLYDESSKSIQYMELTQQCLDLVDEMFEKKIGTVRSLSKELLDR